MSWLSSLWRRRGGSKRLPLPEIREMLADGRIWCELARVIEPDGGSHYYKDTSGGKSRVMIEVETIPGGMDLTCRLATRPTYYIPPVGALVAVLIPSGELEHCPLVVGVLDNGAADSEVGTDKTLVKSEVKYRIKAPSIELASENGLETVSEDGTIELDSGAAQATVSSNGTVQLQNATTELTLSPAGTITLGKAAVDFLVKGTTRMGFEQTELNSLSTQYEALAATCDAAGAPLNLLSPGFRAIKATIDAFLASLPATLSLVNRTL